MSDIFVAESSPEDALVGPLNVITYVTSDPEQATKLLTEGLKLKASDWYHPEGETKKAQSSYFGIDDGEDWKACTFYRDDNGANMQVRLIAVGDTNPQIRPAIDGSYVGGLSIGFPLVNTEGHEERLTALGFPSVVGVKSLEFSSPTGEKYVSQEVHFPGPENIYILGVKRPEIFVPVGPLNDEDQIGAPAYSAQCVADCDATMEFYRDILGYEIRRDMSMSVGNNSGLLLREGSDERFIQAFAPGSSSGYLVFLDHGDDRKIAETNGHFGPPNRGVAMWSFPSDNLKEVRARALAGNVKILNDIAEIDSPFIGKQKTIVLADPGGYPLEIYQA